MFSGNRRFNGRQGEQIYNEELYTLYEILKHFLDVPSNPDPKVGPDSGLEKPGALWLDRQNHPGYAHVMYHDSDDVWKPIFDDWFTIIKDIRNTKGEPENPIEGQLWINNEGILCWFNGVKFVPIKSQLADTSDINVDSFANFLIVDPLKMSGGYIVENLAKLAKLAGGINEWRPNTLYQMGDIVYWTDDEGETRFYKYTDIDEDGDPHTSEPTFGADLQSGYLKPVDLMAQYLIPSEAMDKIFINGYYTGDDVYQRVSDVCIEISLSVYQGEVVAAVHVNPVALKNIRKKIVMIEPATEDNGNRSVIKVPCENTEYYGVRNGFGQFLNEGDDYRAIASGIELAEHVQHNYDFIYAMTYEFEQKVKNKGVLYRGTVDLTNQTCIWIGQINPNDKLLIFAQGLCLEDFYYEYDPYDPSGLIKFAGFDVNGKITLDPNKMVKPLFEGKIDVAVLRFDKKTNISIFSPEILENEEIDPGETQLEGTYTEDEKTRYIATIDCPPNYVRPLVFVQGPNLNLILGDYEEDKTNQKLIIKDVQPGTAYYIVDAVDNENFDMFVEAGTVGEDCRILLTDPGFLAGDYQPLLFVDGFYISIRDFDNTDPKYISVHGLTQGQEYVLLKDRVDERYQLLFDESLSFTTIPVGNEIDDAVVYVDNTLIVDGTACVSSIVSDTYAVNNEIKLIISGNEEHWCRYDATVKEWIPIEDEDFNIMLDATTAGYSVSERTINILQNFGEVQCTYYAYRFADNIEKPLIKGYTNNYEQIGNELFYKIDYRYSYPMDTNALHVWVNGVKQEVKEHYTVEQVLEDPIEIVGQTVKVDDVDITISMEYKQNNTGDSNNEVTINMFIETSKAFNGTINCEIVIDDAVVETGAIELNHTEAQRSKVLSTTKTYIYEDNKNITIEGIVSNIENLKAFRTVNVKGFQAKPRTIYGFIIPMPTDAFGIEVEEKPTCYYIIEEPETGELQSCVSEKLTNLMGLNTYITNEAILAPGVPTVYIDGYRQPQTAYSIHDTDTIVIREPVLSKNKNTIMITNEYGEKELIEVEGKSDVIVEVRRDYRLKEKTVELSQDNYLNGNECIFQGSTIAISSNTIFAQNGILPTELFNSKLSEINIFINGANYGKDFSKVRDENILVLNNYVTVNTIKSMLENNESVKLTFEWR